MQSSISKKPTYVKTSLYEQQNWIEDQEGEETNVFEISNFNFMPVEIEMVGEKTWDSPMSQPLGEDWNKFPPLPQGSTTPTILGFVIFDKGLVTPPPFSIQIEEHVVEEEELRQMLAYKVSEEGHIPKEP